MTWRSRTLFYSPRRTAPPQHSIYIENIRAARGSLGSGSVAHAQLSTRLVDREPSARNHLLSICIAANLNRGNLSLCFFFVCVVYKLLLFVRANVPRMCGRFSHYIK